MPQSIAKARGGRQGAKGMGAIDRVLALVQIQWTGLVNVPVGSTNVGFTLSSTASANIDQRESTSGTPAKTDGSTGLSQGGFDSQQHPFVNGNFIDELTFWSEQIAAVSSTSTVQF